MDAGCAACGNSAGLPPPDAPARAVDDDDWRSHVSSTAGGGATQTGEPGLLTGSASSRAWSSRSSAGTTTPTTTLRVAIEDAIDADMVDGDYGNVVDAVLLWWRDDDGDLVDGLVDALTDLVGGGAIWLLTPKVGRPNAVDAADIAEAAPIAGPGRRPPRPRSARTGRPPGWSPPRPPPDRAPQHLRTRTPVLQQAARGRVALGRYGAQGARPGPGSSGPTRRGRWPGRPRRSSEWGTGPAGGFAALAVR